MNTESTIEVSAVVTPNCAIDNRNHMSSHRTLQNPETKKNQKNHTILYCLSQLDFALDAGIKAITNSPQAHSNVHATCSGLNKPFEHSCTSPICLHSHLEYGLINQMTISRRLCLHWTFLLLSLVTVTVPSAKDSPKDKYLLFVGTYTAKESKGIYAYRFDATSSELTPLGVAAETTNPS